MRRVRKVEIEEIDDMGDEYIDAFRPRGKQECEKCGSVSWEVFSKGVFRCKSCGNFRDMN